jgi:hypothetical protein
LRNEANSVITAVEAARVWGGFLGFLRDLGRSAGTAGILTFSIVKDLA